LNHDIFTKLPALETSRLNLNPLTLKDTKLIYEFNSDPAALRYVARDPFTNLEQAENKTQEYINTFNEKTGIWWAFSLKDTNVVIGYGGIFHISETDNSAEIGYGLLQPYWGKGYISEIVYSLVNYAFKKAQLHRLYAIVQPGNEASIKVLQNNGFKQEGILKESSFARQKYFDNILFGLINNYNSE